MKFTLNCLLRRRIILTAMGAGLLITSSLRGPATPPSASGQEPIHVEDPLEEPADPADEAEQSLIKPLDSIPVPLPPNLSDYVVDEDAALLLGKALFWDMQAGSDGHTACATCHFHAGADHRTVNMLAPNGGAFRGANHRFTASDFPFHRLANPNEKRGDDNPVVFDTSEVAGSQGVIKRDFIDINYGSAIDVGALVPDPVFNIDGANARQVTGRNTPSAINAIYNDRNFWDGRANRFFNGVNPFGDMDPEAKIWVAGEFDPNAWQNQDGRGNKSSGRHGRNKYDNSLRQVRILLDNGSTASQAVGPPLSDVEMSWNGRTFPDLGRKMLALTPLALQQVHRQDSVLGQYANRRGLGLRSGMTYAALVQRAFHPRFWYSYDTTPDGYTLMEQNFALFWGLSIMVYESTLVSDDTPFDRWLKGDQNALSASAKEGFEIFTNQGKCVNCHSGPEFTGAAISQLRGVLSLPNEPMIEFMLMQTGSGSHYDSGFYNIGVRPTQEDLGVGGSHPQLGPWSLTRRVQQGQTPDLNGARVFINPSDDVAVDGAFKTPSLRNVELTGPYMHNGGMRTLEEVVKFYARRADFFEENIDDLDPDVDGIGHVRGNQQRVQALVDFLKSLTDERVRYRKAPFDHPELVIPNGHSGRSGGIALDDNIVIEAVGRDGGAPLQTFEETVR